MKKTKLMIGILVLTAVLLAACSGGQPANDVMDDAMNNDSAPADDMNNDMGNDDHGDDMANDDMMEDKDDNMSDDGMMNDKDDDMMEDKDDDMAEESEGSSMSTPDWYNFEFTEVSTGETFSISQYKGKVVLVETLATWCSNCLKQQKQVIELHNLLGERDDFVSIGISVELEIDPVILSGYVQGNGFDWMYGIADESVQQSIAASFGGQFLNPPATPMFIVDADGRTHQLPLGKIKTANDLLAFLEPYLN